MGCGRWPELIRCQAYAGKYIHADSASVVCSVDDFSIYDDSLPTLRTLSALKADGVSKVTMIGVQAPVAEYIF